MAVDWTTALLDQLQFHWEGQLRPGLDGLSDAEYLWEPAGVGWSLRPRGGAVSPMAAGGGAWVLDFDHPEPDPAPVTSIAWRLGHVIVGVLGMRNASHFRGPPLDYNSFEWSPTAAGALRQLDEVYDAWVAGVVGLDDAALARPCGPAEGPYAAEPMAVLVLHIHREVLHHGAEILLLRDLYRARMADRA